MSERRICPDCGGEVPAGSPAGLCPACLLGAGDLTIGMEEELPSFLDTPPLSRAMSPALPEQIDRYRPVRILGEGGMGTVYLAEQVEPIRRKVALKVIKPGMDTREVIKRFEAERQSLALMDHPGVAKVLDAGETEMGRPFFVMDLVEGMPLTRYCDERRLTTGERLELFLDACDAVQHAHQRGILHRDLKPSNILVAEDENGKRRLKVIDFGIAKAIGENLGDATLMTLRGQILGTPQYMSPEQAGAERVDTRSDIYSLGVILYELMIGKLPFEAETLVDAGIDEMRRIIREEKPPKPSTRLSTIAGEELEEIVRARRIEPGKLGASMRSGLDRIAMKALAKERDRRYETASALADDLQRFLAGEAVAARPPGPRQGLARFGSRSRKVAIFGSLAGACLLAAIAAKYWNSFSFFENEPKEKPAANLAPMPPEGAASGAVTPALATKENPFVNSLGMKFVPVPVTGGPTDGQKVLFSIWETRVKDYNTFIKNGGTSEGWMGKFKMDDSPAVNVTWYGAVAFCEWLTGTERKNGIIGKDQRYRLPTDHEWSCAVGIGKVEEPELLPQAKFCKLSNVFPWGREWPPSKGAGNFYGEETGKDPLPWDPDRKPIEGYDDGFPKTAPVGSFEPNLHGLFDLSGNASEWCQDLFTSDGTQRVQRGGSWERIDRQAMLSSNRLMVVPEFEGDSSGFRCVLEGSP